MATNSPSELCALNTVPNTPTKISGENSEKEPTAIDPYLDQGSTRSGK